VAARLDSNVDMTSRCQGGRTNSILTKLALLSSPKQLGVGAEPV